MLSIHVSNSFLTAHRNMGIHQQGVAKALERISSGKRINSAADDPAGIGISQKMRSQIRQLDMQVRNTKDEINMLGVAEAAVAEIQSIMQHMKELALQSASGTLSDQDRIMVNKEYQSLMDGIDHIYKTTNYNNKKLLNDKEMAAAVSDYDGAPALSLAGEFDSDVIFQGEASNEKTLRETDILTQENAREANDLLKRAITALSYTRAGVGASINVLESRISYLENASINATESLSAIEDADLAEEMMNYAKHNILLQAAQAVMSHSMADQKQMVSMLMDMG